MKRMKAARDFCAPPSCVLRSGPRCRLWGGGSRPGDWQGQQKKAM